MKAIILACCLIAAAGPVLAQDNPDDLLAQIAALEAEIAALSAEIDQRGAENQARIDELEAARDSALAHLRAVMTSSS